MKIMKTADERLSRRDFLKRMGIGSLSVMAMATFGTSLFSSCEKDDDDKDDLAEFEEEVNKDNKDKDKQNNG